MFDWEFETLSGGGVALSYNISKTNVSDQINYSSDRLKIHC